MANTPSKSQALREVGVAGSREAIHGFARDDPLPQLRGTRALRTYREMRDNDPIIGAVLQSMDQMLRGVEWRVAAASDTPEAQREKEFVDTLIHDMSHSFPEFISEVLTFLPFGFSAFETVYKLRIGPEERSASRRSRYTDGRIGVRKLAPRAQWTLERWIIGEDGGIDGMVQQKPTGGIASIPINKLLLFRTVTINNTPSGRSVLRNAYTSWYYAKHLKEIEAIWAERDLTGIPKGKMPADYLNAEAGSDQAKVREQFERILRDVKMNSQGYLLVPSDVYKSDDGQPSTIPLMDIELMGSPGQRTIDTSGLITRYQQDMARAVLADFIMLGSSSKGSFALSKSKTGLFLKSLQGYLGSIASVINRHLLPRIWSMNGLDYDLMPEIKPGDVAPVDIGELGEFIRNLSFANVDLGSDPEVENDLRTAAGFPERAGARNGEVPPEEPPEGTNSTESARGTSE